MLRAGKSSADRPGYGKVVLAFEPYDSGDPYGTRGIYGRRR